MFSDALRILDENTVKYMIDEFKQTIDVQEEKLAEKDEKLEKQQEIIDVQKEKLAEQENTIAMLKKQLEGVQDNAE